MNQTHKSDRNTHRAWAGQACYETTEPFPCCPPTPIHQLGLNCWASKEKFPQSCWALANCTISRHPGKVALPHQYQGLVGRYLSASSSHPASSASACPLTCPRPSQGTCEAPLIICPVARRPICASFIFPDSGREGNLSVTPELGTLTGEMSQQSSELVSKTPFTHVETEAQRS